MNKPTIHILDNGDDWRALYIDGELIDEGHEIDTIFALESLGYKITVDYQECEDFWEKSGWRAPRQYPYEEVK